MLVVVDVWSVRLFTDDGCATAFVWAGHTRVRTNADKDSVYHSLLRSSQLVLAWHSK